MKYFILLAFFATAVLCAPRPRPEDKYTTKFDNVDVDQILKSDRLFQNYYKCLLDQGKCTPDGRELKRVLPDALQSNCAKCSERQRQGTDRVVRFLIDNKPEQWEVLRQKYDPNDVYAKQYRAEAEARGIKV